MRLVRGAAGSPGLIAGFGGGSPPLAVTTGSGTMVVWLPDSKTETKTRAPAASRARARGCLPKMLKTCGRADGFDASKILTCPLPRTEGFELLVVIDAPPETQTKAFAPPVPAKRTSVGSSPTSIVRVTLPVVRSTMLTESESQLTTHASRSLRAATLTGSIPTGISAVRTGEPETSWKTESVALGELTARRRVPSGVMASGCTCGPSKLRKVFAGVCAEAVRVTRAGAASQSAASASGTAAVMTMRRDLRLMGRGNILKLLWGCGRWLKAGRRPALSFAVVCVGQTPAGLAATLYTGPPES
jgi:hypothetical protein